MDGQTARIGIWRTPLHAMIEVFTGAGLRITESPAAAEDLRTTCETLVSHTPLGTVGKFVTDEVPDPRAS
ncbi:hypothetical protein [Streptomyces albogriseolus]|uniref:hypothetical protein n=1 Tax=Streptomyces albogriseolus TaxID=1887 RepID=UPI0022502FFA|nr:hypothetical protein [Streptomyces viridodiastaticus]MCX4618076.1 hypothetical protein [Streptomyces viridodiastaticus]